jgi:hypothetical protein
MKKRTNRLKEEERIKRKILLEGQHNVDKNQQEPKSVEQKTLVYRNAIDYK